MLLVAIAAAVAAVAVAAAVLSTGADPSEQPLQAAVSPAPTSYAEPSSTTSTPDEADAPRPSLSPPVGADLAAIPEEVAAAGLLDPAILTESDTITVVEDGTLLEDLDVAGSINVRADGVTIRNVRVRSSTNSYGIDVMKGSSGTTIENSEVEVGLNGTSANAAIGGIGDHEGVGGTQPGDNVVVRNSYLHGSGDGIKAANYGLYEGNRITMRRGSESVKHIDGIQASGSSGWTARSNWIDQAWESGQNSAIFAQPYTGKRDTTISDIVIENNWVNGGTYTIQLGKPKGEGQDLIENVFINDNVFYGDFKYGVYLPRGGEEVTGNGGVWAESGDPVPTGKLSDD